VGLFGGLLSFIFWAVFFSIFSFAFSLVYCWCTKGRLTLLIKSVYYLSKKKSLRNLQSISFRSIVPTEETKVTSQAVDMPFLDNGEQKCPHLNSTILFQKFQKIYQNTLGLSKLWDMNLGHVSLLRAVGDC
jgi:hypothetical protein